MISKTGYTQLLRKLLGLSGHVQVVVDEEAPAVSRFTLRPTIVLEQDRPEWFWIRDRELLVSGTGSATSAAATAPEVFLFNPVGSTKLAVVTRVSVNSPGVQIQRRYLNTLPGGVATAVGFVRDLRQPPSVVGGFPQTALQILTAAKAAVDGSSPDAVYPATPTTSNVELVVLGAIVLPPGFGVGVTGAAVGVATLIADFDWYERTFTPNESA